jgi:flagellar biosynthesis/type III secretory pathway protein FliH
MKDEVKAGEAYQSYIRGWQDAAAQHTSRSEFEKNEKSHIRDAYNLGYNDGYDARRAAFKKAEQISGHKPTILRAI